MKTLEQKSKEYADKMGSSTEELTKVSIEDAYFTGAVDASLFNRDEIGNFPQAIKLLLQGYCLARKEWGTKCFITKQIHADIASDVIPKMQSLPEEAKRIMGRAPNGSIHYKDQVIILYPDNKEGFMATNYIPDWQDIFAEDWYIVD